MPDIKPMTDYTRSALAAKHKRTMTVYCTLMGELRARHGVILRKHREIVDGTISASRVEAESCYLQLRICCEIIALACLVAHNDIRKTQTGKLPKIWNADRIIKSLEHLHPQFYPQAVEIRQIGAARQFHLTPLKKEHLTKKDLLKLYNDCGDILHRGTLRNVLLNRTNKLNVREIVSWSDKIQNLLDVHLITFINPDIKVVVRTNNPTDNKVHAYIMQKADVHP